MLLRSRSSSLLYKLLSLKYYTGDNETYLSVSVEQQTPHAGESKAETKDIENQNHS